MNRATSLGLLVLSLILAFPPLEAQAACDCSCDAYSRMLQLSEQARAAAQSGRYDEMPDQSKMAEFSRCGGYCARQWAQCANPSAAAAMEQADAAAEQNRLRKREQEAPDPGLPTEELTPDYLQGMWCSVYGGQETTQWRFDAEGNYEIGMPAGGGYAMQGNPRSLEHFLGRFDRLVERGENTFTTEHRSGRLTRNNVFTRGACT